MPPFRDPTVTEDSQRNSKQWTVENNVKYEIVRKPEGHNDHAKNIVRCLAPSRTRSVTKDSSCYREELHSENLH